MKIRRLLNLAIAGVIAALGASPAPAVAGLDTEWLSYPAKFVCGVQDGVPTEQPVVNGKFRTVVNIHNPHYYVDPAGNEAPIFFFKKAVLALPQGQPPVAPSCKEQEFLRADYALAVDCRNIRQLLMLSGVIPPVPFEGFLVIEVPPQVLIPGAAAITPPLDVTVVQTARHRSGIGADAVDYDVQAIEVEQVEPRPIIGTPSADPCTPN